VQFASDTENIWEASKKCTRRFGLLQGAGTICDCFARQMQYTLDNQLLVSRLRSCARLSVLALESPSHVLQVDIG
jgi:hypothetical protein